MQGAMLNFYGLAVWLALLWPQVGMTAVDASRADRLELSHQLEWCESALALTVAQAGAGGCDFRPAVGNDLTRGIGKDAYWLRFTLKNSSPRALDRWLQVGHPRLQLLSLYQTDADGRWHRTDSGLNVPMALRPVADAHPILPLSLAPGETRTFYVRVVSETSIQLNTVLWEPLAYTRFSHGKALFQVLALGGLILATIFTLTVFLKTLERPYLYFGTTLIFEIFQDMGYTGLLQAKLWPPNLPFPLQLQALAIGLMLIFFAVFVREFLGIRGVRGVMNRALLFSTVGVLLTTLWACFANYGEAIRILPIVGIGIALSSFGLFFTSWRGGYRPAGYLMAGFCILLLMLLYRAVVVYGLLPYSFIQSLGFSWYFLLITPLIWTGTLKRSEELREALALSRDETSAKIRFLAQMSHEFRTPLNTILGYAELLERGSSRVTVGESAVAIKRSSHYLLGMIDEILDHARGEAGRLQLAPTPIRWLDFIELLRDSTNMLVRSHSNHFQMTLAGPMPEGVLVDERRLRQVLDNLLTNANRYTRNGNITLNIQAAKPQPHRCELTFTVSDTGVGIAQHELQTIFQPFVRGTAGKNSGIDGVGMGLAISRQLVALMGGEILASSQPDIGSQFSFSITCDIPQTLPQTARPSHSQLPQPYKILVVDDDPNSRNLLSMLLSDVGFTVATAPSGNIARQLLGEPVDLVITDQFMPDGDGWSVLRDWAAQQVPVILLSAAPAERPENLPVTIDFARIELKPFNADRLLDAIGAALEIQWVVAPSPMADDLKEIKPPASLLQPLATMIENGAVTDMAEWLETMAATHPEYAAFWNRATQANLQLDFDALRSLAAASEPS